MTQVRDHPYITSSKGLGGWDQKTGNFCWRRSQKVSPKMCWRNIGMVLILHITPHNSMYDNKRTKVIDCVSKWVGLQTILILASMVWLPMWSSIWQFDYSMLIPKESFAVLSKECEFVVNLISKLFFRFLHDKKSATYVKYFFTQTTTVWCDFFVWYD
jgi:hypothetical protein